MSPLDRSSIVLAGRAGRREAETSLAMIGESSSRYVHAVIGLDRDEVDDVFHDEMENSRQKGGKFKVGEGVCGERIRIEVTAWLRPSAKSKATRSHAVM